MGDRIVHFDLIVDFAVHKVQNALELEQTMRVLFLNELDAGRVVDQGRTVRGRNQREVFLRKETS